MGYSYDLNGRLCCDQCGWSGGVRKVRCPFGWCKPIALCPDCRRQEIETKRKQYGSVKEYHRQKGCETRAMEFNERQAEKRRLLAQGRLIRTAALSHNGRVKVLFQGGDNTQVAYWMAHKTYRAIPLSANATVEDYKAIGKVTKAKSSILHDSR